MSAIVVTAILTAIYVMVAARVLIVARRQSNRIGKAGGAEFFIAATWPTTIFFVGVSILLLDLPTPGFIPASGQQPESGK